MISQQLLGKCSSDSSPLSWWSTKVDWLKFYDRQAKIMLKWFYTSWSAPKLECSCQCQSPMKFYIYSDQLSEIVEKKQWRYSVLDRATDIKLLYLSLGLILNIFSISIKSKISPALPFQVVPVDLKLLARNVKQYLLSSVRTTCCRCWIPLHRGHRHHLGIIRTLVVWKMKHKLMRRRLKMEQCHRLELTWTLIFGCRETIINDIM